MGKARDAKGRFIIDKKESADLAEKIGYDPFNGKVTKVGLIVTNERTGESITCEGENEALKTFEDFIANAVF